MRYDPADLTKAQPDRAAEVRRAAVEAHNRRVRGRIPLYVQAINALKAEVVAGRDPLTSWVKELAPLTREERQLCRAEVHQRHAGAPA